MIHKTVLLQETIDLLKVKNNGVYVDLTLGGGGHSLKVLETLTNGNLIVFDLDKNAINNFVDKLQKDGFKINKQDKTVQVLVKSQVSVWVVNDNFANLGNYTNQFKEGIDGIIADLGWSTDQLKNIEGLSFEDDENLLDMRFDQNLGVKASDLLNALNRKELETMFKEYADIYGGKNEQLVNAILKERNLKLFEKVGDLKKIIDKVFNQEKNRFNYYSKVFQALRIATNQELSNLKLMIEVSFNLLKIGGEFLVITFHSGELKIVKSFFDQKLNENSIEYITKKFGEVYLTPSVDELKENISARSAKLIGIKKL